MELLPGIVSQELLKKLFCRWGSNRGSWSARNCYAFDAFNIILLIDCLLGEDRPEKERLGGPFLNWSRQSFLPQSLSKFGKKFSRGGRLATAAACRQLPVFEPRVAVPATSCAPDWTSASPSCMRRHNARSMTTEVVVCPANEERRRLLNRILYRSRQRDYLELDLLLGKRATDNIEQVDDRGLGALVEVLEEENPDLLSWITGQVNAPENIAKNPVFSAIHKQVSERLNGHSSIETRAQPGQTWVRGWDDNRKIGGPQAGNQ